MYELYFSYNRELIILHKNVKVITCLNRCIPAPSGKPKGYTIIDLQVEGKSPSTHAMLM
jgi:hypothetical protein